MNEPTPKSYAPALVAAALFVLTLGFIHLYAPQQVPLTIPLETFPSHIAGFTGTNLNQMDARIRPFAADEEKMRRYQDDDGNSAEIYVGYFEIQNRGRKIIDYRRHWMHEEAVRLPAGKGRDTIFINKTRMRESAVPTNVYFWYFMNGKIITELTAGKMITFLDALTKRRTNAAVIVILTQTTKEDPMTLITELLHSTKTYLSKI